jgi:hypothetical protein
MEYLIKVRTVDPEKELLLGNGCVTQNNGITVGSDIFVNSLCRGYIKETRCH